MQNVKPFASTMGEYPICEDGNEKVILLKILKNCFIFNLVHFGNQVIPVLDSHGMHLSQGFAGNLTILR